MELSLFRDKVLLGNIKFLLVRIARELDYLHSVKQRCRDRRNVICSGYEHNLAEVKFNLDIAIHERTVLLAVENLKQCRRRITLVVGAELINLIKENDRVLSSRLLNRINNPAGHCADIGFSVTSDFRLIACTAEGYSRKATTHCRCNALCNRCFTHAGRTYKAKGLTVAALGKGTNGKRLNNSLLNLFQSVVIMVKHLSCVCKIELVNRVFVPRQFKTGFKINPVDRCLRRGRRHLFKPCALLEELFLRLFFKSERKNFFPKLVTFRLRRQSVVQLVGNNFHLLMEIIFTLTLVDIFLNLLIDLVFELHQIALARKQAANLFQTLERIHLVKNLLALFIFDHYIRSDVVGKLARIGLFEHVKNNFGRHLRNDLRIILKIVLGLAHKCGRIVFVVRLNADLTANSDIRNQVRIALEHINHCRPRYSVHGDTNRIAVRQSENVADLSNCAYFIKFINVGLVVPDILLSDKENLLIVSHSRLDRL